LVINAGVGLETILALVEEVSEQPERETTLCITQYDLIAPYE
jgi:hypothetical protein